MGKEINEIKKLLPRLSSILYPVSWLLLVTSLLIAAIDALEVIRLDNQNDLIRQLKEGQDINANELASALPETRLARASYLQRQHKPQDALENLSLILNQGDAKLQAKIRYNLGNIYLHKAISQVESGHADEAKTLVTLAKQNYREALMRDSDFWDAKYNLEIAMRLLPDFDRINIEEPPSDQKVNPLWTTVPGFPRGLP